MVSGGMQPMHMAPNSGAVAVAYGGAPVAGFAMGSVGGGMGWHAGAGVAVPVATMGGAMGGASVGVSPALAMQMHMAQAHQVQQLQQMQALAQAQAHLTQGSRPMTQAQVAQAQMAQAQVAQAQMAQLQWSQAQMAQAQQLALLRQAQHQAPGSQGVYYAVSPAAMSAAAYQSQTAGQAGGRVLQGQAMGAMGGMGGSAAPASAPGRHGAGPVHPGAALRLPH